MKKMVIALLMAISLLSFAKLGNKEDEDFYYRITELPEGYYDYGKVEFGENFGCPTIGYLTLTYKIVKNEAKEDSLELITLKLAGATEFIRTQTNKYPNLSRREFLAKYYQTDCKYPVRKFFEEKGIPKGLEQLFRNLDIPELDNFVVDKIDIND